MRAGGAEHTRMQRPVERGVMTMITLFRIFRPAAMWSHRVWPQLYNGQDQNEEKVRENLTITANNLPQDMDFCVQE